MSFSKSPDLYLTCSTDISSLSPHPHLDFYLDKVMQLEEIALAVLASLSRDQTFP